MLSCGCFCWCRSGLCPLYCCCAGADCCSSACLGCCCGRSDCMTGLGCNTEQTSSHVIGAGCARWPSTRVETHVTPTAAVGVYGTGMQQGLRLGMTRGVTIPAVSRPASGPAPAPAPSATPAPACTVIAAAPAPGPVSIRAFAALISLLRFGQRLLLPLLSWRLRGLLQANPICLLACCCSCSCRRCRCCKLSNRNRTRMPAAFGRRSSS